MLQVINKNMDDCKNTVVVTGLGSDIKKEDFIQHFKRFGEILV
jgi:RNA recognition motif-containing protein